MEYQPDTDRLPAAGPQDAHRAGGHPGLLERLGLHRPELRAWAMYDWANSAMVTIIIAAVFPIYFSDVAVAGLAEEMRASATWRFGLATTVGIIIVGVLSPILGAVADYAAVKKRMLGTFLGIGVAAVACMFFIQHGQWVLAAALFVVANIGATGSFVFYDALLPHVAREEELDRVSTSGYALGYIGGGMLLAVILAMIMNPHWFGLPAGENLTPAQATLPVRLAFVSVAVWWVVFSLPLFLRVREPAVKLEADEMIGQNPLRVAFTRLGETIRELRGFRYAFLMLLAYLIYSDGIGTIIRMAAAYGAEIGIDRNAMIGAILITQFVGIPFAFGFGMLAGRIGAKRCIFIGLFVYMGITLVGYFMTSAWHFLLLAVLVGMVQGGTQALSRSLFATMIPRYKSGEFFGFFGVMDRFSGSIGTGIFILMNVTFGSSRPGILAVVILFIAGAILLKFVNVPEGQRVAREVEAETTVAAAE